MEKITKRNIYTALMNYATDGNLVYNDDKDVEHIVTMAQLRDFAEHEMELLDKQREKNRDKKANDMLMDAVMNALPTDEYETIADIAAKIDIEDVTLSKVVYRLSQLEKQGLAVKDNVKVPDSTGKTRFVKGYRKAPAVNE